MADTRVVGLSIVNLWIFLQIHSVTSHLCLLFPRQRGLLDVSVFDKTLALQQQRSPTCTRHELPCGGQKAERPSVTFTSGETVFMQWQQNYNHYETGYPGYMDLAIADSPMSSDFTTLALVSDEYVYAQDYQRNFTVLVKIPEMTCQHCVIRARYNAHKPGETPFLQCADVEIIKRQNNKVTSTTSTLKNMHTLQIDTHMGHLKRALKHGENLARKYGHVIRTNSKYIYGFAFNPFEPNRSDYIAVDTVTGGIRVINSFDFGIDAMNMKWTKDPTKLPRKFMVDGVISIDYPRNTTNILLHTTGGRDDPATMLYIIGSTNGSLVQYSDIFQFTGGAINGMSWYTYGTSATFRIQQAESKGDWYFEAGYLDFGGSYYKRATIPHPESLYVNFQWLETDVNHYQLIYALLGNENAPDALNARIYTFDIFNGKFINYVELDVSEYTFMSMHSYPLSAKLFAFSPGLWDDDEHAWYLVEIDLKTGNVTKRCDLAPKGMFQRYYGGSIYQGNSNDFGMLYHILRVDGSEADMIVGVDPRTCAVMFSEATNLRHVHSFQRVADGS